MVYTRKLNQREQSIILAKPSSLRGQSNLKLISGMSSARALWIGYQSTRRRFVSVPGCRNRTEDNKKVLRVAVELEVVQD